MTSPATRRFTVSDGMVLIAATAVGLGATRAVGLHVRGAIERDDSVIIKLTLSFVGLFLTLALLVLRLWKPRPGLRILFRQPGFAGCFAVSVTIAIRLLMICGDYLERLALVGPIPSFFWDFFSYNVLIWSPIIDVSTACPIAAVWLVMALGGRWEMEPGWVDRAGRALSCFWLVAALIFRVVKWLIV